MTMLSLCNCDQIGQIPKLSIIVFLFEHLFVIFFGFSWSQSDHIKQLSPWLDILTKFSDIFFEKSFYFYFLNELLYLPLFVHSELKVKWMYYSHKY
jgi:hypothetical protein